MPQMYLPFPKEPRPVPVPDRPESRRPSSRIFPGTQSAKLATFPGLTVAEE